ncbi:thioredoxin-like domain-containing protein [Xylariales sp. PMI_506]|nr:thioredoxin-like domain-containing protein [Xylariales sp. PMI_506]
MKAQSIIRSLVLLSAAAVAHGWKHLSEKDFLKTVGGHSRALIAFVEPSTNASRALEPEWMVASRSSRFIGSVDCSALPQVCKDFEIISYPTIRFFDGHGNVIPYRGPRTSASIRAFGKRAARPIVTVLDEEKVVTFQSIDDYVIVGHLNPEDQHSAAAFRSAAARYRDQASFGSLHTSGKTTLVCYKTKDEEQVTLTEFSAAVGTLDKFIVDDCLTPLIQEFSRRGELKLHASGQSHIFYFFETTEQREAFLTTFRPLARKLKKFLGFVTVDAREYGALTRVLGLSPDKFPSLAVENAARGQVFPLPDELEIDPDAIEIFLHEIAADNVEPWSPYPKMPKEAPVDDFLDDELFHDEL